jgi:shikimate kinase
MMNVQRIYLVGFMGSGKSTLGKALANALGWTFNDLDTLFENRFQCSIPEYFKQFGEDDFRNAERQVLQDSFKASNVVFATGGGAPCFFDNMAQMNNYGTSVYLKLPPAALVKRLHGGKHGRPLVAEKNDDELLGFIESKLAEREPFYCQSHLVVEDDGTLSVQGYVQLIRSSNILNRQE